MLSDLRGRASCAVTAFTRRTWVRSILLGALVCAPAAPVVARPLGQPHQLQLTGGFARVVFDDRDGRYLLSAIQSGHGLSIPVNLSDVGASGPPDERSFASVGAQALSNDLAYDSRRNRYLVVFSDSPGSTGSGPFATYGVLRGPDGRTLAGPVAFTSAYGEPAVAYDPRHDQYLVAVATSVGPSRVVGSRLDADLGLLGAPFAVSSRPEVVTHLQPAAVYRPSARDFVVSWIGARADRSSDVFAQRISATGATLAPGNVNLSTSAPARPVFTQSLAASAHSPAAAISWADADAVHARLLRRRLSLGAPRTVSGPDNHPLAAPFGVAPRFTAIGYQPRAREWLVAWSGTGPESPVDRSGRRVESVFGQHLSERRLRERGPDDFPISEAVERHDFLAQSGPALAADTTSRKYLAVWSADFSLVAGFSSVYMRRITAEPPQP
jgi:hypothetical protein